MNTSIEQHEGKKYLRRVYTPDGRQYVLTDVYQVLEAFGVTCQATGHAIKKLLCPGQRGKGDRLADLVGAASALSRAIDLERQRMSLASGGEKANESGFPPGTTDPKEYD